MTRRSLLMLLLLLPLSAEDNLQFGQPACTTTHGGGSVIAMVAGG